MRNSCLSDEEKKIVILMRAAKRDIEAGDLKEAGDKLGEAMRMAESIGDEESVKRMWDFIGTFSYRTSIHSIELSPLETDGLILDIGGGGQGIIGKLNGRQVIAIDKSEKELEGTDNEALKIVMDAADLKFLQKSFDVCTAFFSLMYIPKDLHPKVFSEVYRVLKDDGRFLIWDAEIPKECGDYKVFVARLKVRLPNEEVEAGYGVKWQIQDMEYFRRLGQQAGFRVVGEWGRGEIFFLEMAKVR